MAQLHPYADWTLLTSICRTWAWVPVWSQIEVDIGILAASLPSLSPLLKQAWMGSSTTRPSTPSQLPDFPEYRGNLNPRKSLIGMGPDVEKSLKVLETSYYDDTSDEEIGTAKTADARVAVKISPAHIVYINH
jgi:hypothetical protein